ncbi:MAG TPA: LysR substrate-binding domain-containing protein [Acidimicrobiales bacterium]|nr:LysR substrate-binding domain-containing protein [Acidimicrobiales bacterium]
MELRQLQALVAIADHGSFSAAAAALHTVQSNVSSHIARLERELSVQLVDRHSGQLTEEGAAVVERARRVSAEIEAAVADVAALRHEIIGTARIGMIGTTARWLAPHLLDRMADVHPKVRLLIGDGTTATLEPLLSAGSLDAAVVNLPQNSPDLVERPLFDEDLVLVVPLDHPLASRDRLTLAELDGLQLLLPAPGTAFRKEIEGASAAAGVTLLPLAELDGVRLIASLTTRGYGPAILPATGATEGRAVRQISVAGLPRRTVGLVLRRRGRPSAPARAMLEVLAEVVAANLDPVRGLHPPS